MSNECLCNAIKYLMICAHSKEIIEQMEVKLAYILFELAIPTMIVQDTEIRLL